MRPLTVLGMMLIIAGIVLIIAGTIQPVVISEGTKGSEGGGRGGFAGCVVIFFVPICFTSSSGGIQWVSILSILFIALFIVMIIIFTYIFLKSLRSITYVGSP